MGLVSWDLKFQRKDINDKYLSKYKIPQIYYKNFHDVSSPSRTSILKPEFEVWGKFFFLNFSELPSKCTTKSTDAISFQFPVLPGLDHQVWYNSPPLPYDIQDAIWYFKSCRTLPFALLGNAFSFITVKWSTVRSLACEDSQHTHNLLKEKFLE